MKGFTPPDLIEVPVPSQERFYSARFDWSACTKPGKILLRQIW
jgi:hypothetical protein